MELTEEDLALEGNPIHSLIIACSRGMHSPSMFTSTIHSLSLALQGLSFSSLLLRKDISRRETMETGQRNGIWRLWRSCVRDDLHERFHSLTWQTDLQQTKFLEKQWQSS